MALTWIIFHIFIGRGINPYTTWFGDTYSKMTLLNDSLKCQIGFKSQSMDLAFKGQIGYYEIRGIFKIFLKS